jgi:hypothetical protein
MKYLYFMNLFTNTKIVSFLSDLGSSSMNSIEMSSHAFLEVGKGCSNPG